MARTNRRRAFDEHQEQFGAALENFDDENFDALCDMVNEERRRRGMDDEEENENDNDWSQDYRARRKARDMDPSELPDEGEDGRTMRRVQKDRRMTGDLRAYDQRYSSDPRVNLRSHLAVDSAKADLAIRSRAPGVALDASGEFTKRFPNSARLRPNSRLRNLWEVKEKPGAA